MAIQQICDPEKCTACFICMNNCPQGAIRQGRNNLGEEIPVISLEKCVSCGRCNSVCPVNNLQDKRRAEYCYAAWSKHTYDLEHSSSGGIAAVLSMRVLNDGGVVYGAVSRDAKVFHERIETKEGVDLLRGSKYVKSDTINCFAKVRRDLDAGKKVLFIGTPCQVAAVKALAGDAEHNLQTVDLICHGTPPFSYLKDYLDKQTASHRSNRRWDSVSFRNKKSYLLRAFYSGEIVYQKNAADDLYFSAFLERIILRGNCYSCPYACPERLGDLTIGDFWGLDRRKLETSYDGKVSLVLPNTAKGAVLLQSCAEELILYRLPLEDAMNPEQGNLLHPSVPHADREAFVKLYPDYGFYGAIIRTNLGKKILCREREKRIKSTLTYRAMRRLYHFVK